MIHTLHLTESNWEQRVNATRAVQAARKILGDQLGATLRRGYEAVQAIHDHPERPVLIGKSTDSALIEKAKNALEQHGCCAGVIDLTPEQILDPSSRPARLPGR